MIVLLSPAKTFDLATPVVDREPTQPRLLDQTEILVRTMRRYSPATMRKLMKVSEEIAQLNVERFRAFETPFTPENARPAISSFDGDVYRGLQAPTTFSTDDHDHAQQSLRILSGLYGLLRPLDLIQPYRLEMGTALTTGRGRDLYEYWGDLPSELLRADLMDAPGSDAVINLASQEYFGVINPRVIGAPIISPRFEEITPSGERRMVSFYAKYARGAMAGWLVINRVRSLRKIREFDAEGYHYDPQVSTPTQPVFVRPQAA